MDIYTPDAIPDQINDYHTLTVLYCEGCDLPVIRITEIDTID